MVEQQNAVESGKDRPSRWLDGHFRETWPPKMRENNSPFYITTNDVPNFRKEDESIKRRIRIFHTTSLPNTIPGIDSWIFDHAMDCIVWTAEEIHQHRDLICHEEFWYENCENALVASVDGASLWK